MLLAYPAGGGLSGCCQREHAGYVIGRVLPTESPAQKPRDLNHILEHLEIENGWHVDETAMRWVRQAFKKGDLTKSELAEKLLEHRDECSHMRPGYGLKPNDYEAISKISGIIPILDRIVRCSLEMHPETGKLSSWVIDMEGKVCS